MGVLFLLHPYTQQAISSLVCTLVSTESVGPTHHAYLCQPMTLLVEIWGTEVKMQSRE